MDLEEEKSHYPGWGWIGGGEALHSESGVRPNYWSVTRQDLKFFRKRVQKAVRDGVIIPNTRDPFDPKDKSRGPDVYTVVDQYVKPLSTAAGNMSWALMRHPRGLQSDVFVTHCWAEGCYELINKILASWTSGGNIWCCIFALPQNLNIGSIICEPRRSPFAMALRSASHVMVVSTERASIYVRIWCVFEAYLAMKWGKVVFLAKPSAPVSETIVVALLTLGLLPWFYWRWSWESVVLIFFFIVMATSFVGFYQRAKECAALRRGFRSIQNAEATVEQDRVAILADIGDQVEDVDKMILLLLSNGLSTPELFQAAADGIAFKGMAMPTFPIPALALWIVSIHVAVVRSQLAARLLSAIAAGIAYTMVMITVCLFREKDLGGKAFIRSVILKFALLMVGVVIVGVATRISRVAALGVTLLSVCIALLSSAGVRRVSRVPRLGRWLVEVFGPGFWLRRCVEQDDDDDRDRTDHLNISYAASALPPWGYQDVR